MVHSTSAFEQAALRVKWYAEGWYSSRTCIDAIEHGAVAHGDIRQVFAGDALDQAVTIAELHRSARAVAAGMQERGIEPGDAVAVQLTNRIECAVAYEAVLLYGAVLVPIVHAYGPKEVEFILRESAAKMLVMPTSVRSTVHLDRVADYQRIPTLDYVVVVGHDDTGSGDWLAWRDLASETEAYVAPQVLADDICILIYTSGTVSSPKGVQHSHNSFLAEQADLPTLLAANADDIQLVSFPPGHIAGLNSMMRALLSGSRSVFLEQWDAQRAADLIEKYSVTATSGAPFHLQALLGLDDVIVKLGTLREFLTGAATVTEELTRRATEGGIAAFRCYGMTEHPTVTGSSLRESMSARTATDGTPTPGCSVRIVDGDEKDLPVGAEGEVVVQGPDQFVGYRDPAMNWDAFTSEGWFKTGDLGHLDDAGSLTITDRLKDVVIRGGETISSGQIEDALLAHEAITEAAAVAAPDTRYGEVVVSDRRARCRCTPRPRLPASALRTLRVGEAEDPRTPGHCRLTTAHRAGQGTKGRAPRGVLCPPGLPSNEPVTISKDAVGTRYAGTLAVVPGRAVSPSVKWDPPGASQTYN